MRTRRTWRRSAGMELRLQCLSLALCLAGGWTRAAAQDAAPAAGAGQALLEREGDPARGRSGAPVTLVVFSDFECPYCGRFARTLEEVSDSFGDAVRLVYRQFPLARIHPNALKAAEASLCAHEQGRFWEMHDLMFAEQDWLGRDDLIDRAMRAGVDSARFTSCLDSGRQAERVERDVRDGRALGVSGTPTTFVNGVMIDRAVSRAVLARAIDEALHRTGSRPVAQHPDAHRAESGAGPAGAGPAPASPRPPRTGGQNTTVSSREHIVVPTSHRRNE